MVSFLHELHCYEFSDKLLGENTYYKMNIWMVSILHELNWCAFSNQRLWKNCDCKGNIWTVFSLHELNWYAFSRHHSYHNWNYKANIWLASFSRELNQNDTLVGLWKVYSNFKHILQISGNDACHACSHLSRATHSTCNIPFWRSLHFFKSSGNIALLHIKLPLTQRPTFYLTPPSCLPSHINLPSFHFLPAQ